MNSSRLGRIFSVAVLVSLLAACGPGTSSTSSKTLHVIGTWGGSEQASFLAMVKPWEDRTGNKVSYEGSRDINALLTTRVKAGNPPANDVRPADGGSRAVKWFRTAVRGLKLLAILGLLPPGAMIPDMFVDSGMGWVGVAGIMPHLNPG